jgi:hypothetical protein
MLLEQKAPVKAPSRESFAFAMPALSSSTAEPRYFVEELEDLGEGSFWLLTQPWREAKRAHRSFFSLSCGDPRRTAKKDLRDVTSFLALGLSWMAFVVL